MLVTEIGRDRLGALNGPIHDDDVSGAAANHGRQRTCTANPPCTNDSNLHDQLPHLLELCAVSRPFTDRRHRQGHHMNSARMREHFESVRARDRNKCDTCCIRHANGQRRRC